MRRLQSVSARIMIAISLVAAVTCAGLSAFGLWRQHIAIDLALHRELKSDYVNILSAISRAGAVAACGLAQSMELNGSVAPFILRGVALLGINSVSPPARLRQRAWERIARDLDRPVRPPPPNEIERRHDRESQ